MKVQTPLLTIALVTLVGTTVAQIPAQQPNLGAAHEAKVSQLLMPAEKLIGLKAKNVGDDDLGSIHDLLADPRTGELRYAILDVGGFLGMGSTQRVVPWSLFNVTVDQKDKDEWHLRADLSKEQLSAAPECKDDDWFDNDLDRRIESAFGQQKSLGMRGEGKTSFARLSKMDDDVTLRDSAGREIGEIENLILAPDHNTIAFAVVQANDEAGGKLVAVPTAALHFAYARAEGESRPLGDGRDQGATRNSGLRGDNMERGELYATTKVAFAKFAGAPEYKADSLERMSSTTWLTQLCSYYGCEPFWKGTTAASAPAPKTPPTRQ